MTPKDFIAKWRNVELKERTASHSHFNDLCRMLEIDDPVTADPKGEWFTFEKGASRTSGGEGWADVWRRLRTQGLQRLNRLATLSRVASLVATPE